MVDLLITGVYGQLGRALEALAARRGLAAAGFDLDTLDICDPDAVSDCLRQIQPRVVINCAAYTAVDDCEAEPAKAMAVNGTAVGHLAAACNLVDSTLVQVSTDYVFDGLGQRPYLEDDPVSPASTYGRSKLEGERLARRARRSLIVRTAWLYGHGGRNFVEAIRRQIDQGSPSLRVVSDQVGSPTFCDDLARALLDLISVEAASVVHAVNSGSTSWHGFAVEIARQLGADVAVDAVATSDVPRPAKRPSYSVLDTSRLASLTGSTLPPWQDALARYLGG